MELTIIEQNGWKKSVEIEKAVIRIGSAAGNDVQLASSQIASVQLQLHYLQENPSTCKVLNVGGEVVVWQNQSQAVLPPYAITHISNGSEIVLGEYRVQFKLPFAARTISDSNSIQAQLSFPDASLRPGSAAVGCLSLKNTGLQSACQFEVALQGLPGDCMQVDPVPILYPGAQEEIGLQLFHRKLYPAAGAQELVVMVSAPTSYPGEQVVIRQGVYVAPVLEHSVNINDDMTRDEKIAEQPIAALSMPVAGTASAPVIAEQVTSPGSKMIEPQPPVSVPIVKTLPLVSSPLEESSPVPVVAAEQMKPVQARVIAPEGLKAPQSGPAQTTPPPQSIAEQTYAEEKQVEKVQASPAESKAEPNTQGLSKPRVVRSPSDDFWDEE